MIPWWWLIMVGCGGTVFGVLIMAALNARGPCAQDALLHLAWLYHWIITRHPGEHFPQGCSVDNARRFLDRWGEGEGV